MCALWAVAIDHVALMNSDDSQGVTAFVTAANSGNSATWLTEVEDSSTTQELSQGTATIMV